MNHPTPIDYWTLGIAVLGAFTGIAALVAQVWGLVVAGPRVRVTVANALATHDGKWYLSLDVSNVGRLPVTLLDAGVTFQAEGGWKSVPLALIPQWMRHGPDAPHRLADAEQATWLMHAASLLATTLSEYKVRDVHGYVRLATGTTVRSRNKIDVVNLAGLQ